MSLVATELNDGSARPTGIRERGKEILAVPVLAIYGANASGKTNVLAALRQMRAAVLGSLRWFADPDPVRRVAFALDPTLGTEPSFYEIEIVLSDSVHYTYGFEIDDDRVRGEWLHAYPKGRKQVWFDREDDKIDFPWEGMRGEKLELARRTRPVTSLRPPPLKDDNLFHKYLLGSYGGVPRVSSGAVAREVEEIFG